MDKINWHNLTISYDYSIILRLFYMILIIILLILRYKY